MDASVLIHGGLIAVGFSLSFVGGYVVASMVPKKNTPDAETKENAVPSAIPSNAAKNLSADRAALNDIAAAVTERDRSGKIIFCSPYTEVLTGYSRSEIYEHTEDFFLSICFPESRERVFRSLKVSELSGEPFQFQFPFYHKSGIEMWAESRVVPLFDEDQEIRGTMSVTLDVTAMVRQQQLVEQKNSELKEFTSMVSHDLKAPIYTINGLINVIKEDFAEELPTVAKDLFSTIEKSATRLEQLVQSILDYARLGAKEFVLSEVSLSDVFQDVCAEHQHAIDQLGIHIEVPPLPIVQGEHSALIQIFSNLIGNAIKYRSPERTLSIQISSTDGVIPKQRLVTISDNGLGIPSDRLTDIFKPFVRVHEEEIEGSGVGLATVKKLVEKLGGKVSAESGEAGSTFTVTLRAV